MVNVRKKGKGYQYYFEIASVDGKRKGVLNKVKDTIIYLVRHAETVNENGIRNTNENSQMINEKEILSIKGEEQAKKLSKNNELKNLDIV